MSDPENIDLKMQTKNQEGKIDNQTFSNTFFIDDRARSICVPDYQRAYSWEEKNIDLFIKDLVEYQGKKGYYFGHFIAEKVSNESTNERWEIVDGQQRVTTFVLFLMICQLHSPSGPHTLAYSLIDQFATVSYDSDALETMRRNLSIFLKRNSGLQKFQIALG